MDFFTGLIIFIAGSLLVWFLARKKKTCKTHDVYVCDKCDEHDCICHLETKS